jgi:hypothetical protein
LCRTFCAAIECGMPHQHTQDLELQHHAPQQQASDGCRESQQLEIVSLPQLPSWPAEHSQAQSPLTGASAWQDNDGQQELVTASGAALEFQDISYWLPARQPSLRQRLAQLSGSSQGSSSSSNSRDSRSSSLGHATPASQQQQKRLGKQLLVSVSGSAHAGRLLAVMGPSGEQAMTHPVRQQCTQHDAQLCIQWM